MKESSFCYTVQQLPEEERPRERLRKHGPEVMSASELLAVVLGSGTKRAPVLQLAQEVLIHFRGLEGLADATIEELCQIRGLGLVKAIQLKAIFSLGLRLNKEGKTERCQIRSPRQAYCFIKDKLSSQKCEEVYILMQDSKGGVVGEERIAIGTLSHALVHPREVFYPAIRHKACSIILAHNHPSGDPTPSEEDKALTENLVEVGKLMGIPLNDHLIIGHGCYYSFREASFPL